MNAPLKRHEPLRGGSVDTTGQQASADDNLDPHSEQGERAYRKFLTWCVQAGFAKPHKLVARIVADIEQEGAI